MERRSGLAFLPSEVLGDILYHLNASDHAALWQSGDKQLDRRMRNASNVHLRGQLLIRPSVASSPSGLLHRYSHLVSLELLQTSHAIAWPGGPWKVSILPPTIVTLRLTLTAIIFCITDITSEKIGTTGPLGTSHASNCYRLALDPTINFFDLNALFPRCETLVIEESVYNIGLQHADLPAIAARVAPKLPQSLTHLQHRLISNYHSPNLLPPTLTSMKMRNADYETIALEKVNFPLECLETPYDFAIRTNRGASAPIDLNLDNLKHNVASLKTLMSSIAVPLELFAFAPSLVTIDLRDCIYNNLTQYPLVAIFEHCKSVTQLYFSVGWRHLPLLAANIPRQLSLLSLHDVSLYDISNARSLSERVKVAAEVIARLPSTLRYLAIPGILPFKVEYASQLPPGLQEITFWNCDVEDLWIKNLPPLVSRLRASRIKYSGVFLPSDYKGELTEDDIARLSNGEIQRQRPNIQLSIGNPEGTYEIFSLPDGVTKAKDFSLDNFDIRSLPSALERYSLAHMEHAPKTDLVGLLPLLPPRLKTVIMPPRTVLPWKTFKFLPRTLIRASGTEITFCERQDLEEVARFVEPSAKLHVKQSFFALIAHHFPKLLIHHNQVKASIDVNHLAMLESFKFETMHLQIIEWPSTFHHDSASTLPLAHGAPTSASSPSLDEPLEADVPAQSLGTPLFANLTSFSASGAVHLVFGLLPSTLTFLDIKFGELPLDGISAKLASMTALVTLKLGSCQGARADLQLANDSLPSSITHLTLYGFKISRKIMTVVQKLPALKTLELLHHVEGEIREGTPRSYFPFNPAIDLAFLPPSLTHLELRDQAAFKSSILPYLPSSLTSIKFFRKELLVENQWKKPWEKVLASRATAAAASLSSEHAVK